MKKVSIDRINIHDKRFCITFPVDDAILRASIEKVGIIQPVILLEAPPHTVVTGFKRIAIAQQLGLGEISCTLVNITEQEALLFAIHDNIQRGLNLIEKAHAIERMLHIGFEASEIESTMVLLGLQPHEKVIKILIALASAEDSLKRFVVRRNLPMKIVDYFMRFEASERPHIIELLSLFHVSESTIREILEIMNLLKVKKERLPLEVLKTGSAHELIRQLKKIAYPILTDLQSRLQEVQHTSALPPNIDIKVDPFFEKEYIDISIRARNKDDIEQALGKIRRLTDDGTIGSLFDLTKGNVR